MLIGLMAMIAAQPAAAAPPPAAAPPAAESAKACSPADPTADSQEIIICVERPEGYRINPDVMEADRQAKRKKLKRPERLADTSCQSVGPMGCRGGGGINILGAALTAAEMARRAVNGENVGEMFITDPDPDEYQLYLEAKRKREAERAAKAEQARAAAATAEE